MKRILVTGSNGLLGQKITDLILESSRAQLIATSKGADRHPRKGEYAYEELDIADRAQVREVVAKFKPDVIINTAAMTNVDACEKDKEQCRVLNVEAVKYLVEVAEE